MKPLNSLLFTFAFLLFPFLGVSHAAVVIDAVTTSSIISVSNNSWPHTVSAGSNRAMLVGIAWDNYLSTTIASVTYNGVNMAHIASTADGGGTHFASIYCLVAPSSGTHDVEITANDNINAFAYAVSFTGADQTTPCGTAVTEVDDLATGVSVTVPSGGMAADVAIASGGTDCTEGATAGSSGQTEQLNDCNGFWGLGSTRTATGSFTWTNLAGFFNGQTAVPINSSAAATTAARRRKPIGQ